MMIKNFLIKKWIPIAASVFSLDLPLFAAPSKHNHQQKFLTLVHDPSLKLKDSTIRQNFSGAQTKKNQNLFYSYRSKQFNCSFKSSDHCSTSGVEPDALSAWFNFKNGYGAFHSGNSKVSAQIFGSYSFSEKIFLNAQFASDLTIGTILPRKNQAISLFFTLKRLPELIVKYNFFQKSEKSVRLSKFLRVASLDQQSPMKKNVPSFHLPDLLSSPIDLFKTCSPKSKSAAPDAANAENFLHSNEIVFDPSLSWTRDSKGCEENKSTVQDLSESSDIFSAKEANNEKHDVIILHLKKEFYKQHRQITNVGQLGQLLMRMGNFCAGPVQALSQDVSEFFIESIEDRPLTDKEKSQINIFSEIMQKMVSGIGFFVPGYSLATNLILPMGTVFSKIGRELSSFSGNVEDINESLDAVKIAIKAIFGQVPILVCSKNNQEEIFDQVAKYCASFPVSICDGCARIDLDYEYGKNQQRLFIEGTDENSSFYVLEMQDSRLVKIPVYFDLIRHKWIRVEQLNMGAKKEIEIGRNYGIQNVQNLFEKEKIFLDLFDETLSHALRQRSFPFEIDIDNHKKIFVVPLGGTLVPVLKARNNSWHCYALTSTDCPKLEICFEMERWHLRQYLPQIISNLIGSQNFIPRPCVEPQNVDHNYLAPNDYGIYNIFKETKKYIYIDQRPYALNKFFESGEEPGAAFISFYRHVDQIYKVVRKFDSNKVVLEECQKTQAFNALWQNELEELIATYAIGTLLSTSRLFKTQKIDVGALKLSEKNCLAKKSSSQPLHKFLKVHNWEILKFLNVDVIIEQEDPVHARLINLKKLNDPNEKQIYLVASCGTWRVDMPRTKERSGDFLNRLNEYSSIQNISEDSERDIETMVTCQSLLKKELFNNVSLEKFIQFVISPNKIAIFNEMNAIVTTQLFVKASTAVASSSLFNASRLLEWTNLSSLQTILKKSALTTLDSNYFFKLYPQIINFTTIDRESLLAYPIEHKESEKIFYLLNDSKKLQRPINHFKALQRIDGKASSVLMLVISEKFQEAPRCQMALLVKKIPGISITNLAKDMQRSPHSIELAKKFLIGVFQKGSLEKLNEQLWESKTLHRSLNSDYVLYDHQCETIHLVHFDSAILFDESVTQENNAIIFKSFVRQLEELYAIVFEFIDNIGMYLNQPECLDLSTETLQELLKEKIEVVTEEQTRSLKYLPEIGIYQNEASDLFLKTKMQKIVKIKDRLESGEVVFHKKMQKKYCIEGEPGRFFLSA